ncbi:mucin-binding protein [Loigolactobacillus backii]|nr:KxYKxGKxW signal peptide domain-containing protein [Loigolactobacillus backii]MDA5387763.1 KxYKxGKxW signal peptide domain-containing protein [Loigolactobacillus backii]MDA5390297.1 KxYKxGKxW signal peptide domain-containing protein [Loigolactobacillus backii]
MGKNNRFGRANKVDEHYKMYKAGKHWVFASLAMLSLGIGAVAQTTDAKAAEVTAATTNVTATSSGAISNSVAATSGATSEVVANSSSVTESKPVASSAATSVAAKDSRAAEATAQSATAASVAPASTNAIKTAVSSAATSMTPASSSAASSTAPVSSVAPSSVAAVTANPATNNSTAVSSAATAATVASSAGTSSTATNLVNPTSKEIDAAKASAKAINEKTNQPVTVTAVAAAAVADPDSQMYKDGYMQAGWDLQNNKGVASIGNVANLIGQVAVSYTLYSQLYGLGKVYEAGRIANGVDTDKDIHYEVPSDAGATNVFHQHVDNVNISDYAATDTPYGIDITNPSAWWIDSGSKNTKTNGGDLNYQAGYQTFIKQWAKATDAFYTALATNLKKDANTYANSIAYDSDAKSGSNMPLDVYGTKNDAFDKANKAVYAMYQQAATDAMVTVNDPTSPNYVADNGDTRNDPRAAIQQSLNDVVHVWNAYIPLFQPMIQSYLEKAIMGNPVSLGGQNDFDVQFLNDGTTFADITYTIMNGFKYGPNGGLYGAIGDIKFPQEIFSQYVTNIYTAIRSVIERADYIASIDGENDYLYDLLGQGDITGTGSALATSDKTTTSGKLSFDNDAKKEDTTKLSHDGFYQTTQQYLNNSTESIKKAAFDAAINGQAEDASAYLLTKANTGNAAVIIDKNGNEYADYSGSLTDTNSLIKSVYDAEYQAVLKAIADYTNDPNTKKSYEIVYTQYPDGSYSSKWVQTAANDGTFMWTSPVSMNDTKNWYTPNIGQTTDYNDSQADARANQYSSYTLDVVDYDNMFNYLAANDTATANVSYVNNATGKVVNDVQPILGVVGDAKTYVVTAPEGFKIDDPNYTDGQTVTINLTDDATDDIAIHVTAIIYTPDNPGDVTGTGVTYLQGTANEKITYVNGEGVTGKVPADETQPTVNIYRTAHLDDDGNVVYTNWTTDASGTSADDATVFTAYTPTTTKPGYHGAVTGTTINDKATAEANPDITGASFGNERSTVPADNNPSGGDDDNEYLGKETEEIFNVVRTVELSADSIVQNKETVKVTQTIHYTGAGDATPPDKAQTVEYKLVTNETTGEVSWTPQGNYGAITSPKVLGYTPDQATVATVNPAAVILAKGETPENTTITVNYTEDETVTVDPTDPKDPTDPIDPTDPEGPKYPAGVDESDLNKTVSRTITYNVVTDPTLPKVTTPKTVTQTGAYTRTAIVDAKTGEFLRYGDWTLSANADADETNDGFTAVTSPHVLGYTADQDAAAVKLGNDEVDGFKADTANIKVTYTSNGGTTVEPTDPKDPTDPIDPTDPEGPKYPTGVDESDLNKTVSRTITYNVVKDPTLPDVTTPKTVTQTGKYTRTAIVDSKTGELLGYGDWTLSANSDQDKTNDGFTAVTSPHVLGYTADKNAATVELDNDEVDGFAADTANIKVTYTTNGGITVEPTDPKDPTDPVDPTDPEGPKYPTGVAENDLNKTVSRTVTYNVVTDPTLPAVTTPKTVTQTGKYTRTAIVDAKTGELLGYGDWTLSANSDQDETNDGFTAVVSPHVPGYTADQNATAVELGNDEVDGFKADSANVKVTYTSNGGTTVEPTDPKDPTDPVDPTDPEGPKYPAGVAENDLNKTVSRTITYNVVTDPALPTVTTPKTVTQTGKYTRTAIVDSKTGELLGYGDWTLSANSDQDETNDGFTAVVSPHVPGYTADKNAAAVKLGNDEVDGFKADSANIKVTYTSNSGTTVEPTDPKNPTDPVDPTDPEGPKYPAGVDENDLNKTVSRTITYNVVTDPALPAVTTPKTVTQTGKYTRTAIVDSKTGELLGYGDWTLSANSDKDNTNDGFTTVKSPAVPGYTADKDAAAVTLGNNEVDDFKVDSANVTVNYTSDGGVVVEPTDPKDPTDPVDPTDPEGPKYPAGVAESDLNKTVSRTITYKVVTDPALPAVTTPKTVTQAGKYTRTAIVDAKTGELLGYTKWVLTVNSDDDKTNDGLLAITNPAVPGYTADKTVAAVDLADADITDFKAAAKDITVTYTSNGGVTVEPTDPKDPTDPVDPTDPEGPKYPAGVAESDLNKTVSRTITYNVVTDPALPVVTTPKTVTQTGKYTRTAIVDAKTGELLGYGDWTLSANSDKNDANDGFTAVVSPHVPGYTADQNAAAVKLDNDEVDGFKIDSANLKVTYTSDGGTTVEPTDPKDPTDPVDPTDPEGPKYPAGVDENDLNKTVSRTITYKVATDPALPAVTTPKVVTQTGKYTRTAIVDTKTGELLGYSDWKLTTNNDKDDTNDGLIAIKNPAVPGYTADKTVADAKLAGDTITNFKDGSADLTINYNSNGGTTVEPTDPKNPTDPIDPTDPEGPKYPAGVDESDLNKTVSRTITYKVATDPALPAVTTPKTVTQTGKYTRTAIVDGKTGELLGYSDWKLTTNNDKDDTNDGLIAVKNPAVPGYTADKTVAAVDLADADITDFKATSKDITVNYTSNGGVTVEPTDPKDPTDPIDPTDPEGPKYPAGVDENDLNKTVSRTITYKVITDPALPAVTTPKTVSQTGKYTRTAIVDAKTGELLGYSDWKLTANSDQDDTNDGFTAVKNPTVSGYMADKTVGATELTDADITGFKAASADITVTYTSDGGVIVKPTDPKDPTDPIDPNNPDGPKYPAGVSESDLNKTVSRTITYQGAGDATPKTVTQTASYTRTAIVDGKTGELFGYSDWTVATSNDGNNTNDGFTAVTSPKVLGYTADKSAPAVTLTNDEVTNFKANADNVTVTYTNDDSIEVTDPTDPTQPVDPSNPDGPKMPEITAADLNQTVSRTITYKINASKNPNVPATPQTVMQTTNYKRSAIVDSKTGELLGFTDWVIDGTNNLVSVASPKLENYISSQANVATVTLASAEIDAIRSGNDQHLNQTVSYTFNGTLSTTKDPDGGTTTVTKNPDGEVTDINKTWPDGDNTHVHVDVDTGDETIVETPNGKDSLPAITLHPGETATIGKTTVTNDKPNGVVSMTHDSGNGDGPFTEKVHSDGSLTYAYANKGKSTTTTPGEGQQSNEQATTVQTAFKSTAKPVVGLAGDATSLKKSATTDKHKLPQTGESANGYLAMIGTFLLGLAGLAGAGKKRRHEDKD